MLQAWRSLAHPYWKEYRQRCCYQSGRGVFLSVGQNATLVISFIGYKTIEVKATTNMNITLQEDNELLDEVVVIGYGSVKRKDVTTAVSTVSTKDLDQRPIVSAAQALQEQSNRRVGYATQR